MSIIQFLRIFWARRLIVVVAMITAGVGAFIVAQLVQPRYEATARVMLNLVRPDPVTGEILGMAAGAFFDSQVELVKDDSVTGQVAEALGWLTDPAWINAYARRPPTDTRDFRRWLGQQVADGTEVGVNGSVLSITYKSQSPVAARVGAETLRRGLLETSVQQRREGGTKNAKFYEEQANKARDAAEEAQLAKAAYEKESGIIMDGPGDIESDRLNALIGQATAAATPNLNAAAVAAGASTAALQLAQIDAQIAQAAQQLGPNHPQMQELRAKRASVADIAAQERTSARAAAGASSGAGVATLNRLVEAQKARVVGQRDKVEHLRQLQSEVDLRREQYKSAAARAAQYRLESSVIDNNLTALGVVVTPKDPAFPNKKLMVAGALGLGAALGLALSLLLELLNRRVRGIEDLNLSSEVRCVGVISPQREGLLKRLFGGSSTAKSGAAA